MSICTVFIMIKIFFTKFKVIRPCLLKDAGSMMQKTHNLLLMWKCQKLQDRHNFRSYSRQAIPMTRTRMMGCEVSLGL